ncbi:MAG TPA: AMP-binding protein, partial [Propionibacteriaceae bacterium]|nr:AMP-binding protein [Propionibacteriaceae bacterium]
MPEPVAPVTLHHRSGTDHLARMFAASCAEHGHRVATRIRVDDQWVTQTYRELHDGVRRLALALTSSGVVRGDRVALFASNVPEWTQTDFALLSIGAIPVPLYATSTVEQVAHIVNDSGARMIVIGGPAEAARVMQASLVCPQLERVISITDVPEFEDDLVTFADFISTEPITEEQSQVLDALLAAVEGDDLASIIYTSGTTGSPKGVMLSHRAFVAELAALDLFFDITPDDHSLCFLPLSHTFERAWTLVVLSHGCMNTYVPNAKQVAEFMALVRPTMMVSVPKLFETVVSTAKGKVAGDPLKQKIFDWSLRVGGQMQRANRKGKVPNAYWRAQLPLADKLVLSNVREAMGGPKKVLAAGGAPLRKEVEEFFSACGILICQGYGLNEAAPLVTFNAPDAFKFGTTGRVMPGGQLRIAAEGEIL